MKYGRHEVENYAEQNPHDERVHDMQAQVTELNEKHWQQEPDESQIDFRHRVEQAYDELADPYAAAKEDRAERFGHRERWIEDRREKMIGEKFLEVGQQSDPDLKVGANHYRSQEIEAFEKQARSGNDPELNAVIDDVTNRQAARQEYLTNEVIFPAQEAKLRELGLDKVDDEPKPIQDVEFLERKSEIEDSMRAYRARSGAREEKADEHDHLPE